MFPDEDATVFRGYSKLKDFDYNRFYKYTVHAMTSCFFPNVGAACPALPPVSPDYLRSEDYDKC
jgi:hypothetical protein